MKYIIQSHFICTHSYEAAIIGLAISKILSAGGGGGLLPTNQLTNYIILLLF